MRDGRSLGFGLPRCPGFPLRGSISACHGSLAPHPLVEPDVGISPVRLTDSLSPQGIARGVEGSAPLQVDQAVAFQACMQAFALPEGFASPLAPVLEEDPVPMPHEVVGFAKGLAGVAVVEIVAPSAQDVVISSTASVSGFL